MKSWPRTSAALSSIARVEALEARRLLASVSGYTRDDINTNGIEDSGDWPAPGRTIYADLNRDGVLDDGEPRTVSQSPSGYYQLTGIPAGTHELRQVLPANWI